MDPRKVHLEWSRRNAIALVDQDKLGEAVSSLASDLNKRHDTTQGFEALKEGFRFQLAGSKREVVNWINKLTEHDSSLDYDSLKL